MLRRIFGPKRDEVADEWRKLLNEKIKELYYSSNTRFVPEVSVLIFLCVNW